MKRVFAALLALMLLTCSAYAETVQDLTTKCAITVSQGSAKNLKDGSVKTYWEAEHDDDYIQIQIPANANPGGMMIEWFSEPSDYRVVEYDADGAELSSRTLADAFTCITQYFTLDIAARSIRIFVPKGTEVALVRLCTTGEMPESVQIWEAPVEKADIMLVSTHQDDEELFFGGTIPYYDSVLDKDLVVVYMATCGRFRRGEALSGLWAMGVRNYPEFLCLKDKRVASIEDGIELWGGKEAIVGRLVETIRKYRPEVIVTHDLNGEYGHNQHKITAYAMREAVVAAADATQYPESAEKYGAWEVKKLYLHLSDENTIYMDWNQPSEALDGKTPLQVAKIGFLQHKSQLEYFSMEKHGTKYDNTKFGLVYTTVGQDTAKNDFLENIPSATPIPTIAPTPVPTPEPTPEPTPVVTETPAPLPTAMPETSSGVSAAVIVIIVAGAVLLGAIGVAALRMRK